MTNTQRHILFSLICIVCVIAAYIVGQHSHEPIEPHIDPAQAGGAY